MAAGDLFPELRMYESSGLSFPWAEYHPRVVGNFNASLGASGISLGMTMLISWANLLKAATEILGFSYRDASSLTPRGTPWLRRQLPWQHPYLNQLVAKQITNVQGIRMEGTNVSDPEDLFLAGALGALGPGYTVNYGPWAEFNLAVLTIQFWRPPYYLRSDADILDGDGNPQEWLRYTDKAWQLSTQMLSREGSTFVFSPDQGLDGRYFQGSVGQKISKLKLTRTWYQVPEQALFGTLVDQTPSGIPTNMLYTQTSTVNPVTGFVYPAGQPICGCVNSPLGSPTSLESAPYVTDTDPTKRFFGCFMGTLLLEGVEFKAQPLHLPPYLMKIPAFSNNEAISQQQYDVIFHYEWFDPPRVTSAMLGQVSFITLTNAGTGYTSAPAVALTAGGGTGAKAIAIISGGTIANIFVTVGGSGYTSAPTVTISGGGGSGALAQATVLAAAPNPAYRGHNLNPFSGTGFWYQVQSQQAPITTPFQFADLSDLFFIL